MSSVHTIIVHHKGREMLDACIRSVLESTDGDHHVVVVENGCDEDLPEIVHRAPTVHRLPLRSPTGFARANNIGAAWCRDQLGPASAYYFLNNDTVSTPGSLARLTSVLESNQRVAVVGPRLMIDWARDHLNSLGLNVTEDAWGWDEGIGIKLSAYGQLPGQRPVLAVTGSALLMDADLFWSVEGWTELYDYYFEDIDLCLKCRSAGRDVVNDSETVVYHHISATMTLESERKEYLFWRNRLLLAGVHWPWRRYLKLLRLAVVDEVIRRPWRGSAMQRRALRGAAAKSFAVWRARYRRPGRNVEWTSYLRPVRSVPVIHLPERSPESTEDETVANQVAASQPAEATGTVRVAGRTRGSRVVVFGASPLLHENALRNFAPGARTWQLAAPIIDAGHDVLLIGKRLPQSYPTGTAAVLDVEHRPGYRYVSVDATEWAAPGFLSRMIEEYQPSAAVFAHASASFDANVYVPDVPAWFDLNGHLMTEAQAKAAVYGDDRYLDHFFGMEIEILRRGDRFSSCCGPQTHATVGELGLIGRLNGRTNDVQLVSTIPVGVSEQPYTKRSSAFRGLTVDDDAFVVLWSGGYNTWTDVDTMFRGLEYAMGRDESIHMVSTGGQIDGHDEMTYPRFVDLVNGSRFRERFHLCGWVPRDSVPDYYLEADIGINCEKRILEVELGSKQRILDWSRAALPCVSSRLTELSRHLEDHGIGWVYDPGDWRALGEILVSAARDREETARVGARARDTLQELFNYRSTCRSLLEWLEEPVFAPDRERSPRCVERQIETIEAVVPPPADALPPDRRQGAEMWRGEIASEGLVRWGLRVTYNSLADGGLPLLARRAWARMLGRRPE